MELKKNMLKELSSIQNNDMEWKKEKNVKMSRLEWNCIECKCKLKISKTETTLFNDLELEQKWHNIHIGNAI